uniref:Uncharacterized protein n=1 Tax=Strombidium inclinatum TaxID=197538 RepID=A0A7S3MXV4_9SPIT
MKTLLKPLKQVVIADQRHEELLSRPLAREGHLVVGDEGRLLVYFDHFFNGCLFRLVFHATVRLLKVLVRCELALIQTARNLGQLFLLLVDVAEVGWSLASLQSLILEANFALFTLAWLRRFEVTARSRLAALPVELAAFEQWVAEHLVRQLAAVS